MSNSGLLVNPNSALQNSFLANSSNHFFKSSSINSCPALLVNSNGLLNYSESSQFYIAFLVLSLSAWCKLGFHVGGGVSQLQVQHKTLARCLLCKSRLTSPSTIAPLALDSKPRAVFRRLRRALGIKYEYIYS